MTIRQKNKKTKTFISASVGLILTLFFTVEFVTYNSIANARDTELSNLDNSIISLNKEKDSTNEIINELEKKKRSMQKQGIDVGVYKQKIRRLLSSINTINIDVQSVDYHNNYNNLVKVVLVYRAGNDEAKNIINKYATKKILDITNIKKALSVYGDYEFKDKEIVFYSFTE